MLRLGLLENIRHVADDIIARREDCNLADTWADRLLQSADNNSKSVVEILFQMSQSDPKITNSFVVQITQRLQGSNPLLSVINTWIEQQVANKGLDVDQICRSQRHTNYVNQISIRNSISSLRFVNTHSWKDFVEQLSVTEAILKQDPSGIYGTQDFDTRDACRHVVERLANHNKIEESEVAQAVLKMCTRAQTETGVTTDPLDKHFNYKVDQRKTHVGYWLLDPVGLRQLRESQHYKIGFREKLYKKFGIDAGIGYIMCVAIITFVFVVTVLGIVSDDSVFHFASIWTLPLIAALTLTGSQFAVSLVNYLVVHVQGPRLLPRMDFHKGIPDEERTMVVVPTMLTSPNGVKELIEDLQVRYLVNRDKNMYFGLITDFVDSKTENAPNDQELVDLISKGINELNQMYPNVEGYTTTFYLFHRKRMFNKTDNVWMGWERKRGKIEQFNSLLRGGSKDPFSVIIGDLSILQTIKYVITLDTDTMLPSDAGRKMIETAAHVLNRPIIDDKLGRVVSGYGLLQPRVSVGLTGAHKSIYAKINSYDSGLDPYTKEVSDVYQDLFDEGSFIGKGLYHVGVFEKLMTDLLPQNRILSHDLLEGCYIRSGLVSDVELIEEYPASYATEISRRHRWVRGDWQIAQWILPFVPLAKGLRRNTLHLVSKWKIFDNLRRSLVPLAMVFVLIYGLLEAPFTSGVPLTLIAAVLSVWIVPNVMGFIEEVIMKQEDVSYEIHLKNVRFNLMRRCIDTGVNVVFLPFDAYNNVDAIVRSLYRIHVSGKGLLEWTTSTAAAQNFKSSNALVTFTRTMWVEPLIAGLTVLYMIKQFLTTQHDKSGWLFFVANAALSWTFLAGWLSSTAIATWLSAPLDQEVVEKESLSDLPQENITFLKALSRKTFRFFEAWVREEDNYLPIDNFQEFPKPVLARRTSPTNIGMALLSFIAASDFGNTTISDSIDRVTKTLLTLSKMDRFRGHFYNWYDTADLKPLLPRYVSAVDSGNLVGLLVLLRTSLLEFIERPILSDNTFTGLSDNLLVLDELIAQRRKAEEEDEEDMEEFDYKAVEQLIATLKKEFSKPPRSGSDLNQWFDKVSKPLAELTTHFSRVVEKQKISRSREEVIIEEDILEENIAETCEMTMLYYANSINTGLSNIRNEIKKFAPWITTPLPAEILNSSVPAVIEFKQKYNTLGFQSNINQLVQIKSQLNLEKVSKAIPTPNADTNKFLQKLNDAIRSTAENAQERVDHLNSLADMCNDYADEDFSFMYNETRNLIAIGYNVDHKSLDKAYYDVFCSEARLCSYVGIARGQFPVKHWFSMSRLLTQQAQKPALLSWSGSMFEYLMPLLVMPTIPGTLLDQAYTSVVKRQIEYGEQKKVPWGISESAYNMMDAGLVYQYGPFGVPGLGLKRGLSNDLVIAPYASVMALMVLPLQASQNLMLLHQKGFGGNYGMIEAADFTPHRLRGDISFQPIRSFFSHHEGMSFLALAYALLDKPMQKRFSNTPELHANELLLQEKIPKIPYVSNPNAQEKDRWAHNKYDLPSSNRRFVGVQLAAAPEVHLLSNGRLHVMISTHGGGQLRYKDLNVTRWREDVTLDGYGISCYLRDVEKKNIWSTTSSPIMGPADSNYKVMFSQAKAEFKRNENGLLSETIVSVSSHDDVEVRRVNLTNNGQKNRQIELTTYGEIVLGQGRADAAHRAFSNLFIKTEILPEKNAILASRQPRSHGERVVWAFHIMLLHEPRAATHKMSFETDRYKFIGRGHSMQSPACLQGDKIDLDNTEGFPLDPIISIRQQVNILPKKTVHVDFITGVAFTREEALKIIDKYQNKRYTNRVINYSWISSEKLCFRLGITEIEAQLFAKLAGCLLYSSSRYRASAGLIAKNRGNQSSLWRFGISGDLPIMLVRIGDVQNLGLIEQCLQAHVYLRYKGLVYDLVIWNDETASYRDELQHNLMQLVSSSKETSEVTGKNGGIHTIRGEQLTESESILLYAVSRVVFSDNGGSLTDQIDRANTKENTVPMLVPRSSEIIHAGESSLDQIASLEDRKLSLINDLGGFDKKEKEYVIYLDKKNPKCLATPQPWVNVIANEQFGTVVSEKGSAYTWFDNAHEFRLSPWNNDIVVDGSGETFYIRDETTGKFWSPMPQPVMDNNPYVIRHGMGYSTWEHSYSGIHSETLVFVPQNEPVKVIFIKLKNKTKQTRQLSVSGFVEWTLGELRDRSQSNIVTDIEIGSNSTAVLARNSFNMDFSNHVAFFSVVGHECTVTADRSEFIGYNRTLADPAGMYRTHLSGTVGAALDPCAAIHVPITIEADKEVEIAFIMGAHRSKEQAKDLIERIRSNLIVQQLLKGVKAFWTFTLNSIQVETPDPQVDVLANGWLLYQVLSSRIWGRSGFYQSSGAFGFRDQLQDTLSVIYAIPQILHDQIITCCEHQFGKGDVCHWWHPQSNRGVRTTFSDDYLWLPLALAQYVDTTNDESLLGVNVRFLTGPELAKGEESHYDQLKFSDESATVYEHAKRAVKYGLKYGRHGLPLMGCGDWNDGMNLVGIQGEGESVWLAYFLYHVLEKFEKVAEMMQDDEFIQEMRKHATTVQQQIEKEAWDGQWYRRAFFDDGTPLGSSQNDECQIDSLPQSWGVISGAADKTRVLQGLQQAYDRLVRKDLKLIQLFDPPFEKSELNPGYIKGYAPGVRENGGQYTHAAIWMVWAYTILKENRRAWELFDILNPISHTMTRKDLDTYRVEPYVVAADVYTLKGHEGHGGWTWYTGSAGWMYRLIIEQLLGVHKSGDYLVLTPCPRPDWKEYKVHYRHGRSVFHISFVRAAEATKSDSMLITVDGVEAHYSNKVQLVDDNTDHYVQVHLL